MKTRALFDWRKAEACPSHQARARKSAKEGKGKMRTNTRNFRLALTSLMLVVALFGNAAIFINPVQADDGEPVRTLPPGDSHASSSAPGYCPSIGGSHLYEYIKEVIWTKKPGGTMAITVIIWIDNPTGCVSGEPCPEYDASPEYINAWIDWNGNRVFEGGERVLDAALTGYLGINYYGDMSTSNIVTIPSSAVSSTWMRVNLGWGHDPNDPCEYSWTWGDIVDKEIHISRILPGEAATLARNEKVLGAPYVSRKGYYYVKPYYYFDTPEQIGQKGLDCSGLSFWSYNRAYYEGKALTSEEFENRPLYYYGADGQYHGNIEDKRPRREELIPGDLIFFDAYADSNKGWKEGYKIPGQDGHIDHVAMYVGPFVHEGTEYNVVEATGWKMKIVATTIDKIIERIADFSGEASFKGFGRATDYTSAMKFTGNSPIDLVVTDPDGITLTKEMGDTFGMAYMEYDINGDGEPDDIVAVPERKIGNYLITVIPEPGASPTDTYTLEGLVEGRTIVLAKDVQISDIPSEPYIVESKKLVALTGNYQDYGTDIDGDGIFDYLTVDTEVMLENPGYCVMKARLMDVNGEEIAWAENTTQLEAGLQTIQLNFDGRAIYNHVVDGPYYLRDVYIYHTGDPTLAGYVYEAYTTNPYSYTDFAESTGTATGTGDAFFGSSSGTLEDLTAIDEGTLPTEGKPDLVFPHGFFSFDITGLVSCTHQTVVVTVTLPSPVQVGTQYWKYHASEGGWIQIPMGDDDVDNVITITLEDGGLGDDDGVCDGVIVDQGGPGYPPPPPPPPPIPVGGYIVPVSKVELLAPWMGLAALMTVVAVVVRRRIA